MLLRIRKLPTKIFVQGNGVQYLHPIQSVMQRGDLP